MIIRKFDAGNSDFIQVCSSVIIIIILLQFLSIYVQDRAQFFPSTLGMATNIAFQCKNEKIPEQCYSEQFRLLTNKTDINFSKDTLLALQELDSRAIGCHLIAHTISIAETYKDPGKWLDMLKNQDYYVCSGGFLHGVLEAKARYDSSFDLTSDKFTLICSEIKDKGTGELSCNHNLGHILLAEQRGDIQKSIAICTEINAQNARYECMSGVFMENLTRLNLISHGLANKIPWDEPHTKEIEQLCLKFNDTLAAKACWKEISYMYITLNKAEPRGLFESCKTAPVKSMEDECYIYGAGNMVIFTIFNPSKLVEVCTVFEKSDPYYRKCLFQIIGSHMASSDKLAERVISLCLSSEESFKAGCFDYFSSIIKKGVVSIERRNEICRKFPDRFKDNCLDNIF